MSNPSFANAPADDARRLLQAASEALSDEMIERLASAVAGSLELLDRLTDETTSDAIGVVIDRVTELHRLGALNTLFDIVVLLHAARDASTDSIVERLFGFFEQMISTVGNEDMARLADNTRQALDEAAQEATTAASRGGLFATIALLSKPEAQRSLAFLLRFADKLQRLSAE
jgi:uncharacterized protein YjgD (DUF1641 family)